jgi:hypothetical protein
MSLHVDVHDVWLTALLDSGSTHNFVGTKATAWAGIPLSGYSGLCAAITDRDHLESPGYCHALKISIGDEQFAIDYYNLALGFYHMV